MVLDEAIKCETLTEVSYKAALIGVARFVARQGGTYEEAKDIFHDALVIFYERHSHRVLHVSPEAYVVGIARHLWIKKFNHDRRYVSLDAFELTLSLPEDYFPTVDEHRLLSFLREGGQRCLDLLKSFFYDRASIDQIKIAFGFKSAHSVSVQKYKCIEKIRERIDKEELRYEDFID